MSTERQNTEPHELKRLREEASQTRKVVFAGINSDSRASMQESEKKFGWPYARLFPLIGKHVMTQLGPGELLTVQARECEISPGGRNDKSFRVKPDHIRMIGGESLVTHEEQEAMDQYLELLGRVHAEQRKRAKA